MMTTERDKIISAAARSQLAFFFLYFNISVQQVSILPAFIGWILFLTVIDRIEDVREDAKLLRPFAYAMIAWEFAAWVLSFWHIDLEGEQVILSVIVTMISIYFIFQIMTDFAAIAGKYEADHLVGSFKRWRSIQVILQTAVMVVIFFSEYISEDLIYVSIGMGIVFIIASICLIILLGDLKGWLRNPYIIEKNDEDWEDKKCLYEADMYVNRYEEAYRGNIEENDGKSY